MDMRRGQFLAVWPSPAAEDFESYEERSRSRFEQAYGADAPPEAQDIGRLLNAGADKVSINTAAVKNRQFVKEASEKFGAQCIVVAIDAKRVSKAGEPNRWEIFTHGGRTPTGIDAIQFARDVTALGAGEILLTSMDRDGTKAGFDLELTRAVSDAVTIPVIASGGVGTREHVATAFAAGADAVLAASVFHDGDDTVTGIKADLAIHGIRVRQ